jgi:hypothetical protein
MNLFIIIFFHWTDIKGVDLVLNYDYPSKERINPTLKGSKSLYNTRILHIQPHNRNDGFVITFFTAENIQYAESFADRLKDKAQVI